MAEPKRPLELYGFRTDQSSLPSDTDECPFLGDTCIKQRKSDPSQTIGTCIVGFEGQPQLICPVRMRATNQVFEDVVPLLSNEAVEIMVIPEIILPKFGNVVESRAGPFAGRRRAPDGRPPFPRLRAHGFDQSGVGTSRRSPQSP